jgi:hypothetical protein
VNGENGENEEIRNLKYSYDRALEIFRLHNDNYFKRVQIIMVALQAGLFFALIKLLHPVPESWEGFPLPILVTALGIFIAVIWQKLMNRQMQYLELLKRYIRNLEAKSMELGVPIDYFNVEAAISGPKDKDFLIKTARIIKHKKNKKYRFLRFKWSREKYPGKRGEESDKIHRVGKKRGGAVRIERMLSKGTIYIWAIVLFLLIVIPLRSKIWGVLKTLCS